MKQSAEYILYVFQVASVVSDSVAPWTVARQAPQSIGIFQARILEWAAISFSTHTVWSHLHTEPKKAKLRETE